MNSPARPPAKATGPKPPLRPQRLMAEAARDAARQLAPSGLGLDSAALRERMVARLAQRGVTDGRVLAALKAVERHRFVATALAGQAYEDTSLPIGHAQTISKPSVVARMLEWLLGSAAARACGQAAAPAQGARPPRRPLGRVLEIGGGCGYQAAVLAQLADQVVSIERIRPLVDLAVGHLSGAAEAERIRLVFGDGMPGYAPLAPYHHIIAAAGGEDIPKAWMDQLAIGGRLVAPARVGKGPEQQLVIVDRAADGLHRRTGEAVQFVPLKSGLE